MGSSPTGPSSHHLQNNGFIEPLFCYYNPQTLRPAALKGRTQHAKITTIMQTLNPVNGPLADQELINKIVYLGSLVSDIRAIDPMMNVLRRVTATRNPAISLNAQDRGTLENLEIQLRNFLVNQDHLRSFTPETLEQRVREFSGRERGEMSPAGRNLLAIIVITLGAIALPFIWRWPVLSSSVKFLVAGPAVYFTNISGAAWLIQSALKNFTAKFRKGFIIFSYGLVGLCIAFSQYAFIPLLGLDNSPWFKYIGFVPIVLIPYIVMYFGIRTYTRAVGIQDWASSLRLVAGAIAVVIGLLATGLSFFPRVSASDAWYYLLSQACFSSILVIQIFSARLSLLAEKAVTPGYARPLKWIVIFVILGLLGALISVLSLFIFGALQDQILAWAELPLGLLVMFSVYAGYRFKHEMSR